MGQRIGPVDDDRRRKQHFFQAISGLKFQRHDSAGRGGLEANHLMIAQIIKGLWRAVFLQICRRRTGDFLEICKFASDHVAVNGRADTQGAIDTFTQQIGQAIPLADQNFKAGIRAEKRRQRRQQEMSGKDAVDLDAQLASRGRSGKRILGVFDFGQNGQAPLVEGSPIRCWPHHPRCPVQQGGAQTVLQSPDGIRQGRARQPDIRGHLCETSCLHNPREDLHCIQTVHLLSDLFDRCWQIVPDYPDSYPVYVSPGADWASVNENRSMSIIKQKTALVTGASTGIGAAIAARLAAEGFHVIVNYANNDAAAVQVVQQIKAAGGSAIAAKADVSDAAAVRRIFEAADAASGGIDVLVNNAGIMKLAAIADSDEALFDRQVAVNLWGTINTMREAAKRMQDGGKIVNFSSSVVGLKLENYGVYAGIKAAVETITAILSKELRGRSINVNAIAPGPTATQLFIKGKPQEVIDRMSKMAPMERLGTPEDIANAVAFLVGPDAGWINGQTLRANGGLV